MDNRKPSRQLAVSPSKRSRNSKKSTKTRKSNKSATDEDDDDDDYEWVEVDEDEEEEEEDNNGKPVKILENKMGSISKKNSQIKSKVDVKELRGINEILDEGKLRDRTKTRTDVSVPINLLPEESTNAASARASVASRASKIASRTSNIGITAKQSRPSAISSKQIQILTRADIKNSKVLPPTAASAKVSKIIPSQVESATAAGPTPLASNQTTAQTKLISENENNAVGSNIAANEAQPPYAVYSTPFLAGGEIRLPNLFTAVVTGTKNLFNSFYGDSSNAEAEDKNTQTKSNDTAQDPNGSQSRGQSEAKSLRVIPPVIRLKQNVKVKDPDLNKGVNVNMVEKVSTPKTTSNQEDKKASMQSILKPISKTSMKFSFDDDNSLNLTPMRYSKLSTGSTLSNSKVVRPLPATATRRLSSTGSTIYQTMSIGKQVKKPEQITVASRGLGGKSNELPFERLREDHVAFSEACLREKVQTSSMSTSTAELAKILRTPKVGISDDSVALTQKTRLAQEKDRRRSSRRLTSEPKKSTMFDMNPVQTDVDLVAIKTASVDGAPDLRKGVAGLKETCVSRTNTTTKDHQDKDFIDHFAEKQGMKYISALEELEKEYTLKLSNDLKRVKNPEILEQAQRLFPAINNLAKIAEVEEEKDLQDYEFGLILEHDTSKFPIDVSRKVGVLRKMHIYAVKMLAHWIHHLKHNKPVTPHQVVNVATELLADMMIPEYGTYIKIAGYLIGLILDLEIGQQREKSYGPEARIKAASNVPAPTPQKLIHNLRNLLDTISDEVGAVGESFANVLIRIPEIPYQKIVDTITQLFMQVNYANIALSRAIESLQPLIKIYTVLYLINLHTSE